MADQDAKQQADASSDRQICYLPKGHDEGEEATEHEFEPDRGPIEDESRYCMVSD